MKVFYKTLFASAKSGFFVLLTILVLGNIDLNAQVSTYTFAQSSGTYTPISGGTVLGVPTNDDNIFAANPIGFNFCYNGAIYTQFGVCANGWIYMGNATGANSYNALSTGTTNNVISAFNFDIQGEATIGDLQYSTIGTAPNRTLVVQWTNYDAYQSVLNTDNYNFQIRLSESNGQIDIVYGSWTANAFHLAQVGLRGGSNADFNNRVVSNGLQTWATSIAGVANGDACESNTGLIPASGQTYTWSQPTAPALPISATFTGVTATGMTVNWIDNSTNEATFFVQRSTDNVTFTTVATIPSTSIATTGTGYNYVATNLYNNTLYYWRILAGNANCGGGFLAAQQSTLPGTLCGTYTVGPTGAYTSLTAAFAAVATNGVNCPLVFDLQAAYVSTVETFPLVIPFLGNGPANTITVRPELGATNLSITSTAAQTIDFSSAQYITFDGRPGSVGTVQHLTIENTSTTGNAVRFINDGAYNGFNYCILRGVNTSATSGVVLFSTAAVGGIGNSNNSFTNCEFRDGATTPANLVYASNFTANVFNSGNTFTNNLFHDWFSATAINSAITVSTGNTAWTVSNNSFYQTASRTFTTGNLNLIVNMASGSGSATGGYIITGNYFGGTAALCGGTAYTSLGAVAHRLIVIQTTTGTGGTNSIQGNTISNFNFTTTSGTTTTNGIWCAINTTGTSGANNIGNIAPNVIGSTTVNAQIVTSTSGTGGLTVAYNNSATGAQNFSNNQIGGITANSSSATISSSIVGIQTSSGTANTISGNMIGSLTQLSSFINAASTGATGGQVSGIVCSAFNSALPGNQITNNTVMNLTNQYAGTSTAGYVRGIVTTSGIATITGNTIANLSNTSSQTGTTTASAVIGISQTSTSTGANHTVAMNTISNLASLSLTANVNVNGIIASGSTAQQTLVHGNSIIGLGAASSGTGVVINGINMTGGICRVYNNFVNLGVDATGASLTLSHEFNGINKNNANRNTVAFNTVNIGGTGVGAGASNSNAFRRVSNPAATPADSVYSNIFVNVRSNGASTGSHYAININNNTNFLANGNNYYGNGTGYVLGIIGATPYAGFAAWQVASTQDVNSFVVNPNFISLTNLHINNATQTPLESRAIPMGINTDYDLQARPGPVGSVNGGGTVPDIGADEFDGFPVNVDVGVQLLVNPLTTGCHGAADTIRVRVRNNSTTTLDLSINNVTINGSVTGPNPIVLGPVVLNSGTIAPAGTVDVVLLTNYNMTTSGTYVFNASTAQVVDFVTSNDAMAQVSIVISGGTYTATSGGELCLGDSANLVVAGYTNGGTIQWQSSPDNISWTNIPGATTTPYNISPTDTTFYRAIICGLHISTVDTLFPELVLPAITVGDTICGTGTVTLSASGSGTLNWYDAATGGSQVNSGTTYSLSVSATDTFYVENTSGTPPSTHTTTFAAGNGSSGNVFTIKALNTITITSFDGHLSSTVGTPSSWEIWYRPNDYLLSPGSHLSNAGWTQLGTVTTPSAGPGVPTVIPIPLTLQIPAGQTYSFQIFTTTGQVSYTNGTTLGALYNANTDLEVYQGHGGTAFAGMVNQPRVFNGIIHYAGGCASMRTPVIALVTPAPLVTVSSSNNICGSGSSTLIASSSNPAYNYVWTPAGSLNTPNGDTVIASPTSPTVYLVTATDVTSGCLDTASVSVGWAQPPSISVTVSDDTVCANTAVLLDVVSTATNPAIVGTSNTQNTATSYPAPYGQFYWGSRHQMMVTAADLTAAGLVAGNITALSFEIVNTNASAALDNFEIKIGNTAVTSLTAFESTPMTSVFLAPTYMPTTGINTHTFSTPFFWDGVSNIIVETCHNNASFTDNCTFRQTATAYSSTVYYRADAAGVCGNNAVTGSIAQRPNMRFWSTQVWNYSWTPVASVDSAFIANPTGYPTVSGDFVVTVTDSMTGCVSADSVYVMVNPNPAPAFGADTAICSNTSLMLDGTAGPYSYMWQDSTMNQMYTVNSFGTYSVLVTDSLTGCIGTDTILVGINAAPSFTLGADATVCAGTQVTFSGPSGAYDYMWSTLDSVITITTGAAGSYELAVTDQMNGCTSMDTVMLNVNPVPTVALGADTTLCSASGSITLSGPAGPYSYQWSTLDSSMAISVNSTGNYFVVVTDTATSCLAGDTIQVTYNMTPTANIGSDTTFCSANGPIIVAGPFGPYSYMWSDSTTGSTISVGSTGLYYVDVMDTLTGCTVSDSIMVTVPMSPSFTLTDTAFCGTQYTINGPAGPYAYSWNTSATTPSITVTTSGTYSLTVTDSTSGCTGMDSSTININANPTVTASGSDLTPCADDANVTLTGSPVGGTFTGTSVTGSQFDPSIGAGTYQIVYNFTDVNGCSGADTISVVVSACVGIDEQFMVAGMTIYPNPNAGSFTFTAADQNCAEMTIEIVTVEGQVIQTNKYSNVQGNFVQDVDMTQFANGVYIMRVTTDGAVYTNRVVKQD